jgi:hypothetical protein
MFNNNNETAIRIQEMNRREQQQRAEEQRRARRIRETHQGNAQAS